MKKLLLVLFLIGSLQLNQAQQRYDYQLRLEPVWSRVADILKFSNDAIPVAHQSWAGDHAEYIDFNMDGSFLVSAHQNGLIKLWVWMGEDPDINDRRHEWVKTQQKDAEN